jgi:hypothetical protein
LNVVAKPFFPRCKGTTFFPNLQYLYYIFNKKTSKKVLKPKLEDFAKSNFAIYPLEIAPLGQTSAQVPHSVHKSASIV